MMKQKEPASVLVVTDGECVAFEPVVLILFGAAVVTSLIGLYSTAENNGCAHPFNESHETVRVLFCYMEYVFCYMENPMHMHE